ncbi:hypothetical protein IFM89_016180 [Coptis chinensis]|uniref:Uncharacterized protein n=1 Tax=Coptis chinensis TaxID=261450 RepID=A0A835LBY3_9MAGN|nr:hypothetical protein IFM89_016180 [Coptis chinensis]
MPPALQDNIDSQLEKGGEILPPNHEVEKKIDNGKRKLEEIEEYDDYEENVEPNYFNKKKQNKLGKGRKTTTNKVKKREKKKRVSKKERAPEPEKPEGMRYFIAQMQGKDIDEWVNTKDITLSDTLKQQNRLYMPNEVVEILREEEKEKDEPFERKKMNHLKCMFWILGINAEEKGVRQTGNSCGGNGGVAFTNEASTSSRGSSEGDGGAFANGANRSSSGPCDGNDSGVGLELA